MSLTSLAFWEFFIVFLIIYWLVKQKNLQNVLLLTASYLLYGWVNPWFALILFVSTLIDYAIVQGFIKAPKFKRHWLAIGVIANLGMLLYFKYINFFIDSYANVLGSIGIQVETTTLNILVPLGISFYTLKKLSYLIDAYRTTQIDRPNIIDYALYVSFFPQIISGPIDRHQNLLPQIQSVRHWSLDNVTEAVPLLVIGLFKKFVISDTVAVLVNEVFSIQQPTLFMLYAGSLGFALQILADFSGYTDLSRGIAYLLGFKTPHNFNTPYLSLTPSDFWNRWHITFSQWLRDYVFFPLRRALLKRSKRRETFFVLAAAPIGAMFISGLWHGAGWTYILWGLYYGILIALYQALGIGGQWKPTSGAKRLIAWVVMFHLIVFGWTLFRSPSISWLIDVLFNSAVLGSQAQWIAAIVILTTTSIYAAPLWIKQIIDRYRGEVPALVGVYLAVVLIAVIIFINTSAPEFLYAQF